jgi:hypothetical protein
MGAPEQPSCGVQQDVPFALQPLRRGRPGAAGTGLADLELRADRTNRGNAIRCQLTREYPAACSPSRSRVTALPGMSPVTAWELGMTIITCRRERAARKSCRGWLEAVQRIRPRRLVDNPERLAADPAAGYCPRGNRDVQDRGQPEPADDGDSARGPHDPPRLAAPRPALPAAVLTGPHTGSGPTSSSRAGRHAHHHEGPERQ